MVQRDMRLACAVCVALTLAVLVPTRGQSAAVQATFHVAPGGSDENPGTADKPFQTLDRARQAVRKINANMTGDIVVQLRGGTYASEKTFALDATDSGTGGHNVIYRAAPGEAPAISGGKRITGWEPDKDGRWKARTTLEFRQVYVNGHRAVRARGAVPAGLQLSGEDGYTTTQNGMAEWRNPSDIEFCYRVVWCHTRCKVARITPEGNGALITMLQPWFTLAKTKEGVQASMPNYVENALELLDEPGEWYLDRAAQTLYYLPRTGEDMKSIAVVAPAVEKIVELRGTLDRPVQHVRFEGLTFVQGGWLRPSKIGHVDLQANFILDPQRPLMRAGRAQIIHNEGLKSSANIVCHAAKAVRFERCTFTQLGGAGIDLEFGSQDNVISGCHFHDISGSAIQVGDVLENDHHPDDLRMVVKNNTIANNYIHDVCVEYMGGVGVFVGYTEATTISHNEVSNVPYSGMSIGWGWGEEDAGGGAPNYHQPFRYDKPTTAKNNRIELNYIHHVMQTLADGGGIYTLSNQPGTVIRNNHIHDDRGCGIYLDEGSGFIEVTGNWVYATASPLCQNNRAQNRIATCKTEPNFFNVTPDQLPEAAKQILNQAGLEAAYKGLLQAQQQ